MVKNIIKYIFIYILLMGCDTQITGFCESDCSLEITAPDLQIDENGYYHIEWLGGYVQTFSTLNADTYSDEIYKVYWGTNSGIIYMGEFVGSVNHTSYTNENGIAHTVLSVWEEQILDTISVYSFYEDGCGIEHNDTLGIIVDE